MMCVWAQCVPWSPKVKSKTDLAATSCLLPLTSPLLNSVVVFMLIYKWWVNSGFCGFVFQSVQPDAASPTHVSLMFVTESQRKYYRVKTRQTPKNHIRLHNNYQYLGNVLHPLCPCWLVPSCDRCYSLLMHVVSVWYTMSWIWKQFPFSS